MEAERSRGSTRRAALLMTLTIAVGMAAGIATAMVIAKTVHSEPWQLIMIMANALIFGVGTVILALWVYQRVDPPEKEEEEE